MKRWVFPQQDGEISRLLATQLRISPVVASILVNRGITDAESGRLFLQPTLNDLAEPNLLPHMKQATERIRKALRANERIVIYCDYDVDGLSGCAILYLFLKLAHGNVGYYIPHRMNEGYGLNPEAIRTLRDKGTSLIITVDCGINAVEEAELAKECGIDMVITDHHEPGEAIPDCIAVVNPKLKDSEYSHRTLSGAGVAFKLAWSLAQSLSPAGRATEEMKKFLLESMALVALGTIADIVPLLGENRTLAKFGLKALQATSLPGLRALLEVSGLEDKTMRSDHISFRLAPRINAAGRLGEAEICLHLLTTDSREEAEEIARTLDEKNRARQQIERKICTSAFKRIDEEIDLDTTKVIVLADESWHSGVVGIVASRIASRFDRPAVVIAIDEEGIGHGSARSIPGFHFFEALAECSDKLASFGGHAQAAGLRIRQELVPGLAKKLNEIADKQLTADDFVPKLNIETEVSLPALTNEAVKELSLLGPFGEANRPPILASRDLRIAGRPRTFGKEGQHISFYVTQGVTSFRAVGFRMSELAQKISDSNKSCSLAYVPKINDWDGRESVELEIKDIAFDE